jgi:hypothetical protein
VSRVGDVNADGFDDWGIVTGIDKDGVGGADTALALIYGTNLFPIELPAPSPPGTPVLRGNRIVEIGTELFIHILNGHPGQPVTLYKSTQLGAPIGECGGTRTVHDLVAQLTFDFYGQARYFEQVPYDTSVIGTKFYFQARAEAFGPYPCRLSTVREVRRQDLTDPDKQ